MLRVSKEYAGYMQTKGYIAAGFVGICYNCCVGASVREEVFALDYYILTLLISVAADVISHYICKWLDR